MTYADKSLPADFDPYIHVPPYLVRKARAMTGKTAKEAAAMIGHTPRAWYAWEAGDRKMKREYLDAYLELNGLATGFTPGMQQPAQILEAAVEKFTTDAA